MSAEPPTAAADRLLARLQDRERARLRSTSAQRPGSGRPTRCSATPTCSRIEPRRGVGHRNLRSGGDEAQIGALEVVPRRRMPYRASRWRRWTSTPFWRDGRPWPWWTSSPHECPGSRHAKRYEDVLELLEAGDPRDDRGEHPAHRDAQRRHRPHHRRPCPRDRAGHVPRSRR